MASSSSYDRLSELQAFDATKAGVKGLVDAGVTAVPRIFHHPGRAVEPETLSPNNDRSIVPVIDLAATKSDVVAQVKAAAETLGLYQVINHGIPAELLDEMLASVKRFHEEPAEAKARYYTRQPGARVMYQCNFDLFVSPAANWRDTLFMAMAPPPLEEVPPACRDALPEYTRHVKQLAATLLELLSEALGVHGGYLEQEHDEVDVAGQYYPPCPEPHLTMGSATHSDPTFLTVLLQDGVGGLQVFVDDDGSWVDVPPLPCALVVHIGDLLQLVSNDRFKSAEHRVVAMDASPRVSVACFFRKYRDSSRVYSPIISQAGDESPRYRGVTVKEYLGYNRNKGLGGRVKLEHFRLGSNGRREE